MGTIATSTATNSFTNAFGYPPNSMMDINVVTGHLWIVFKDQTNRGAIYKSTDAGGSWSFQGNFTISGQTLEDICEMRIDARGDHMHLMLLGNNGSIEIMSYKRIGISTGTPDLSSGAVPVSGAGTLQSVEYAASLVPVANPDGSWHVFIAITQHGATSGIGTYVITVRNDAALTTFVNDGIIGPGRQFKASGDDTSMVCTVDVEHNGDGITSANPNVWVAWQKDSYLAAMRFTWKGYKAGWTTPTTFTTVLSGRSAERDTVARWDGQRFVILSLNPSNLAQVQIVERNANNTSNVAVRTSPSHPGGTITGARAMSYNYVTKDVRIYAVQGSNTVFYIDYFRGSNTWGAWTTTGWTTPVGSEWGLRHGTWGTAQYDAYTLTGAGSPWTVTSQIQAVNFAPTAPTWVIGGAGTVSQNGAAYDVAANLTLDWDFHDVNLTDIQSSYALSRQIGAAAAQWWRTSDSTWQVAETFNSTASTAVTLTPAQWLGAGGAADPAHVYKVTTKDSGSGTLQSAYSAGLALVPSTRVDPTVTAPTVDQVLNLGNVVVTWTVTEQSQWRVRVLPTIASDNFGRTVSSTWSNADYGGAYTNTGGSASDFSVSGGTGRHSHAATNTFHESKLAGVIADDINLLVSSITIAAVPLTQPVEWGFRCRYIDANNYSDVRLYFNTNSIPNVVVRYVIAGVETFSSFVAPGGISGAGPAAIRFVADGPNLSARIWPAASAEPNRWDVTLSGAPADAGAVAIRTNIISGNTNTLPFVIQTDGMVISDASLASYDSGFIADPLPLTPVTTTWTVPLVLPDGYAGLVTLQTKNAEGLASVLRTVPFTVDFVEPAVPSITTISAAPAAGGINVAVTQPAASGTQPATTAIDIYRRKVLPGTVAEVNANPYFETNANDWTNSGYSTAARSTVQSHTGVASILLTPNGATATPKVQTTALYPTPAGTRWEWRGWVRSTTTNKTIRVYIDWYDGTPTLLSSTIRDVTPVATTWVFVTVQGTAPVGAVQARIAVGQLATPAAGDTLYADEMQLLAANTDPGIRVFANVVSGATYLDWRAVTGVDYEYRGYAEAANGTSVYGAWTD